MIFLDYILSRCIKYNSFNTFIIFNLIKETQAMNKNTITVRKIGNTGKIISKKTEDEFPPIITTNTTAGTSQVNQKGDN